MEVMYNQGYLELKKIKIKLHQIKVKKIKREMVKKKLKIQVIIQKI